MFVYTCFDCDISGMSAYGQHKFLCALCGKTMHTFKSNTVNNSLPHINTIATQAPADKWTDGFDDVWTTLNVEPNHDFNTIRFG